uniref:Uncharacterized protein n=1 Tax=Anopheles coluzzii TaxID=1518534 RepID=A0A8W7PXR4_ANOCL
MRIVLRRFVLNPHPSLKVTHKPQHRSVCVCEFEVLRRDTKPSPSVSRLQVKLRTTTALKVVAGWPWSSVDRRANKTKLKKHTSAQCGIFETSTKTQKTPVADSPRDGTANRLDKCLLKNKFLLTFPKKIVGRRMVPFIASVISLNGVD